MANNQLAARRLTLPSASVVSFLSVAFFLIERLLQQAGAIGAAKLAGISANQPIAVLFLQIAET